MCSHLNFNRIGNYSNMSSRHYFNLINIAHRRSLRDLIEVSYYQQAKKETHSLSHQ